MSREIVTSENREEYNNKKLGIKNEKDLPYYDEKGNIYHGKEIVGSLKLEKEPKYHRLSQININSKHQGKGIGSHIIKTVLKEVPGKGIGLFANENILVNTVIWQFDFPDIKIWDSKYLWDRKETMDFLKKYGWLEGEYWYPGGGTLPAFVG